MLLKIPRARHEVNGRIEKFDGDDREVLEFADTDGCIIAFFYDVYIATVELHVEANLWIGAQKLGGEQRGDARFGGGGDSNAPFGHRLASVNAFSVSVSSVSMATPHW